MKHFFILLAATVLFTACKKDKQGQHETITPFKKKLTEVKNSGGNTWNFVYHQNGNLSKVATTNTIADYILQPFSIKYHDHKNNIATEFKNTIKDAAGRIINADRYFNGIHQSKFSFSYNEQGFLNKTVWERIDVNTKSELNYFYENDNLVKITDYFNGQHVRTYTYDYDAASINPLQLDIDDYRQIGYIGDLHFGKLSKNLLKKETLVDKNGNLINQTQFIYVLDAEGYLLTLEKKRTNGTDKYTFKFE